MDAINSFPISISYTLSHICYYSIPFVHWQLITHGFLPTHTKRKIHQHHIPLSCFLFLLSSMNSDFLGEWCTFMICLHCLHFLVSPAWLLLPPNHSNWSLQSHCGWVHAVFCYLLWLYWPHCPFWNHLPLVSLISHSLDTPLTTFLSLLCDLFYMRHTDAPLGSVLGAVYSYST